MSDANSLAAPEKRTSIPFIFVASSFPSGSSRANPKRGPPQPNPSIATRSFFPGLVSRTELSLSLAASVMFIFGSSTITPHDAAQASNPSSLARSNPTTTSSSTVITGTPICPDFFTISIALARSRATLYSVNECPFCERYSFAL